VAKQPPTPTETVEAVIADFDLWTSQWADAEALGLRPDTGTLATMLGTFSAKLTDAEAVIDTSLGGNAALRQRLRDAYTALIHTMMPVAASRIGVDEGDLYRRNSGRIPMWAWQTAHHTVAGITTPVAENLTPDKRTGKVSFAAEGFAVTIAKDRRSPGMRNRAETTIELKFGSILGTPGREGGKVVIKKITGPPTPTAVIQTTYGRGVTAESSSGYGRGTTAEDTAAGAGSASTKLGFHEGSHGLDYVEYMKANSPPAFTGEVGMSPAEFRTALKQWKADVKQYSIDLMKDSEARTDCVGTTEDDYMLSHAKAGAKVKLICP
jgi:hypothetical protein